MSELFLLIDQTSVTNKTISKAQILELNAIFPNLNIKICTTIDNLQDSLKEYTENYIEQKTTKKLILQANQQSLYLATQYLKNIPFGYIKNGYSFNYLIQKIKDISSKKEPQEIEFIHYNEQVTQREGLCSMIKFGKKAQAINFKHTLNHLQKQKLQKKLQKLAVELPKYYKYYSLDVYTKGKFLNFEHIVSGQITSSKQNLNLNLSSNYFQDLNWFNFSNKRKLTDYKFRILATAPTVLAFDDVILPAQPFDLNIETKTITIWH